MPAATRRSGLEPEVTSPSRAAGQLGDGVMIYYEPRFPVTPAGPAGGPAGGSGRRRPGRGGRRGGRGLPAVTSYSS